MELASIEEIAAKWGITPRQVRSYCAKSRIAGATLEKGEWRIPANAAKPERKRRRTFPTTILGVLEAERKSRIPGGLYHRLQIDITYNSNHIEGSRLTHGIFEERRKRKEMRIAMTIGCAVAAASIFASADCGTPTGRGTPGNSTENSKKENTMNEKTIYDFTVKARGGKTLALASLKGKVLLVVNTATGCGFTPQYEGLEKLYGKYHAKGLEILDFPCDQFGHQAPGSDDEIHQFCALKYSTSFDQLSKIEVNGTGAEPLYKFLKAAHPKDAAPETDIAGLRALLKKHNLTGAIATGDIEWNFTKFLIDRDGNVVKRFHPTTTPEAIAEEIERLL